MIKKEIKASSYYWYGVFTIIPLAGLIVGILLLRKGIILKDKILCFIGAMGIILTVAFYIGVIFYSKNSEAGKEQRVQLTEYFLRQVMQDVELYKYEYGHYPDSIQELKIVDKHVLIGDPLSQKGFFSKKLMYFNYKKIDTSHYMLFSSGLDQVPNTVDDIYPNVSYLESKKFGLIRNPQ